MLSVPVDNFYGIGRIGAVIADRGVRRGCEYTQDDNISVIYVTGFDQWQVKESAFAFAAKHGIHSGRFSRYVDLSDEPG